MTDEASVSDVRFAAMNFLALREHSAKELADKLARRFSSPELIDQVISVLKEQNLQSDERFAQEFIRLRQRQGKGSVLIKMELRDRGVPQSMVAHLLDEGDVVWHKLAIDVHKRRFKKLPSDAREKAKQIRFLQSRGFASRHIQAVFSSYPCDDD